ncbi:MAG: hypothetical protein JWP35_4653 [Caulobacter sp.]|nr:hypothetical protein [Caulobacter sp.]
MTSTGSRFVPEDRQIFAPLERLGEALREAARRRWPTNTAKEAARAWNLDSTTAENITKGHASERTLTKAAKAERWALWMALGELMFAETYEDHLEGIIKETELARQRLEERRDRTRHLEARAALLVGVGGSMAP